MFTIPNNILTVQKSSTEFLIHCLLRCQTDPLLDISSGSMNYISINTPIEQKSRAAFRAKIDLLYP